MARPASAASGRGAEAPQRPGRSRGDDLQALHPADALRRLIAEECDESAAHALGRYASVLTNLAESSLRTPTGEKSLRDFVHFVGSTHSELAEIRAAYDAVGQHCEELRRHLDREHDGRMQDGFRMAVGAMGYDQALQAERQARTHLEAQLHSLQSRLTYSTEQQQRQAFEFRSVMRTVAEAEVEMEERLRAEVGRQTDMIKSSHGEAVRRLQAEHEQKFKEAQRAERALRRELEQEQAGAEVLRGEAETLDRALEPLRTLHSARAPVILDLIHFLSDEGPELLKSSLPCRARVPVLALEWPPNTELDTTPSWTNCTHEGVLSLLHRLCQGELKPEDVQVTACCVDGRWIGGLHGHEEAPRLAALLMFQGLRPDITVLANARVVPMKRPLLPRGVLELDPKKRSAAPVGPHRIRPGGPGASGPAWNVSVRPQPDPAPDEYSDEGQLRLMLKGCPMERDLLSALCYVRAAMPEALGKNSIGNPTLSFGPASVAVR
mmetsp:Transcript_71407/g.187202  ORF Transcript_71407/g.187202 Transcript_71407/m.187202 type:complete len:494 (-) Transcript_71407:32-1513(-)